MDQVHLKHVRVASGLLIIAALWLIVSPYGLGLHRVNPIVANSVITGILVAVLALIRAAGPMRFYEGISWANFAVGLWLVASPFLLGFAGMPAAMWNAVVVGLFVMALSAWSALEGG